MWSSSKSDALPRNLAARSLAWGDERQALYAMRWYSFSVMLRTIGGEFAFGSGADIAPQPCIRWTQRGSDHDAAMRIGGEAPGWAGPFFETASRAMATTGAPPPRIVIDGSSREQTSVETVCDCYLLDLMTPGAGPPLVVHRQS